MPKGNMVESRHIVTPISGLSILEAMDENRRVRRGRGEDDNGGEEKEERLEEMRMKE